MTCSSCAECPSLLRSHGDVDDFFGQDFGIGVAACARFGHVLGKPGLDQPSVAKLQMAFAESCSDAGMPMPESRLDWPTARVGTPDPDVYKNADGSIRDLPADASVTGVSNCRNCSHFVPASVVASELGWNLGLCAAQGRLLLNKRLGYEPKNCTAAQPGVNRSTTDGVNLLPPYEAAFDLGGAKINVGEALRKRFENIVDPQDYPSDYPVSDEDRAIGIRAWRKITDPDGIGQPVPLPIFDIDSFEPAEQAKIPRTGDETHPEWYVDHAGLVYNVVIQIQRLDETPLLIGPPGVGKTELWRHLAWLTSMPFERISVTASTEIDDLAGKYVFVDNETKWQYGRVPLGWKKRCWLLLDEPNTAKPDVWQFLRPITDNSKQLVLDQASGLTEDRNEFCFLGMAINPSWDPRNIGAEELAAADSDRLVALWMDLPPAAVEREIIRQRCKADDYEIPEDTLDRIMKIADEIRTMSDPEQGGTLLVTWGVRLNIKVARQTAWFSMDKAYRNAVVNSLDPTTAEIILRTVAEVAGATASA